MIVEDAVVMIDWLQNGILVMAVVMAMTKIGRKCCHDVNEQKKNYLNRVKIRESTLKNTMISQLNRLVKNHQKLLIPSKTVI